LLGHTLGQYLNLNILVFRLDISAIIFKVQPSLFASTWVFLSNRKVHWLLDLASTAQQKAPQQEGCKKSPAGTG
tara:strand:+ start:1207 stop:1428 length:222 start_codon:yes stop_codon:yes gene_type:complete